MNLTAPLWRATLAQLTMELRLTTRRGENLLVILVVPLVVLLFFSAAPVLPEQAGGAIDFLVPGVFALSIISTSFVNLGIATAYERSSGVLKRLGASPLSRTGLVAAKLGAVGVVEIVQAGLLLGVATLALRWEPGPRSSVGLVVVGIVVGTVTFAGLGLFLAGRLRAEATLAFANGLFLAFVLLGGIVVPVDQLPGPIESVARFLPSFGLSETLRIGFGASDGDPLAAITLLLAWAAGVVAAAVLTFRWE
jgi:ABC-2 type transport system permease protein